MKANVKSILFFLFLILVIVIGAVVVSENAKTQDKFTYGDLQELFDYGLVKSFEMDNKNYLKVVAYEATRTSDGVIVCKALKKDGTQVDYDPINTPVEDLRTYSDGSPILLAEPKRGTDGAYVTKNYTYRISLNTQIEYISERAQVQKSLGLIDSYNFAEPVDTPWFLTYLPYIVIFGGIIFLYIFMYRQTSGKGGPMNNFAKAHTKSLSSEKNPVRFADVAGADEEKAELEEVVEFLRDPQKYVRLGARIPRGVLLVGPPGTGKTLLAKAVAGEAGVPFYSISGSDFVEMYVGVGASRVRDLFATARRSPASIIFIDEIDAVGRHRGAGLGGGHDEREQTLNQLLVEMDGFGNQEGVIVLAATNRPDILDPALLRPGRFDRQVTVNYPDLRGREEILKVHVRNKPLEANVDLHKVAMTTVGFTGADLANLMNEAALLAASRGKELIGMPEIDAATLKVLVGTEKKNKGITEKDRKLTAYHEAGHAIVSHCLPGTDPVTRISIIPTSKGAGGYTLMPPQTEKSYEFKNDMLNEIAVSMGGRVAEELIFGDFTGGASADIKQATRTARKMITVYGMSDELGTVCLAGEHSGDEIFLGRDFSSGKEYSEVTASKIDAEIKRIIDEAHRKATEIIRAHMDKLHCIAEYLTTYEVMEGDQFKALMDDGATLEDLARMAEEKERRSREENEAAAREARQRAKEREEEEKKKNSFTDPYSDFFGRPDDSDRK